MDSYFLNGSNFKSGFTAGTVQIPTEASPGVPVGLPIPYIVNNPIPRTILYSAEYELTPNTKTFVPLTQMAQNAGTIISLNGATSALVFDYSRVVSAQITASSVPGTNVNIFLSYYDIYGNIGFNQTVANDSGSPVNTLVACLAMASIYLTSDAPVTVTIQFILTNTFELPITDNGLLSQLLFVSAKSEFHDGFWARTINDAEPYAFQWDGIYSYAGTDPSTLTQTLPRPWFEIQNNGETFNSSISSYSFVFMQNVFGTGNPTQFANPSLPQIGKVASELKYVYGQPNFTEGFTPWQG